MPAKIVEDYYTKKKRKLIKDFAEYLTVSGSLLAKSFENAQVDEIQKHMKAEFENLIPKIPYIGGAKNAYTPVLIQVIYNLVIFRTLEKEGYTYREIGELFYEFVDAYHEIRKQRLEKIGKDPANYPFEPEYIDQAKRVAGTSQKRNFPQDWVLEYVEGDGISFEWGSNIYECGVYKIFKELGAEKYVPLQCVNRIREANIFGYGVYRTQTIATGAPSCDYRYSKSLILPQKLTEEEISISKEKKICLVCKGQAIGYNIFICPQCETVYCQKCTRTLEKMENACWVCNTPFDTSKPAILYEKEEEEMEIEASKQSHKKKKNSDLPVKK